MSRFKSPTGARLQWRVVVRTTGRVDPSKSTLPLAWHLVHCTDPLAAVAHCAVGQNLLTTTSDPDGHCLRDGLCPRCDVGEVISAPQPN